MHSEIEDLEAHDQNTHMATARLAAANTWLQEEIRRLRLTDAERSVLREVRDIYAYEDDVECNEIAAVIDGLLERTRNGSLDGRGAGQ